MAKLSPTVTLKGGHHLVDGPITKIMFKSSYNSGVIVQDQNTISIFKTRLII